MSPAEADLLKNDASEPYKTAERIRGERRFASTKPDTHIVVDETSGRISELRKADPTWTTPSAEQIAARRNHQLNRGLARTR
ncbi:hypothetical protein M1563_02055 [Patescibacteria group bacterium]|nr:hypothetical protein [Patescibacteria group bacterium]